METTKTIRKSFKFRIYPSKSQVVKLETTLDLCRELYNAALQERRDAWRLNKISISYSSQANQLKEIKAIRDDLTGVTAQVLQDILRRCEKAYREYYRKAKLKEKAGKPRFKGQNRFNSFCYPQVSNSAVNIIGNKINLPKIGKLKIKLSRQIQGKVKICTVKREIDKWFVVFTVETTALPLEKTNQFVGLDVGISAFVTLSDGTKIDNSKFYESAQKKLRIAQRRVSRRKTFSSGWKKAQKQVSKIHQKIRNRRNDFQHKLSTILVRDFDLIAIEKLNILGLSKGILSKQINDVAWSNFFCKLKYKAENAGKSVVEVNPNYTSQDCSACNDRVKKDLSERTHHCLKCGLILDRDENAAINILALGQSVLAQTQTVRL